MIELDRIIVLSRTTRQRLRVLANSAWVDTATARDDGRFDVPVSRHVVDAIARERRTPDETDEAVILRIMRERGL